MKIVFFGTTEFGIPALNALLNSKHEVLSVVTSVGKAGGRGLKLNESPIKKFALTKGIKILQPKSLKDPLFLEDLKLLNPDMNVVIAFRMLPEVVWNMPVLGTINIHASLLPDYRGASPINTCIINGENQTGLTCFKLKHEIDTGDVISQIKVDINTNETFGELHDRLSDLSSNFLLESIEKYINGEVLLTQGISSKIAKKIYLEDCLIDFNKSCVEITNLVRGLSPNPCAYTLLNGKKIKIFSCDYELINHKLEIGSIIHDKKTLKIACKDGLISLKDIQLEGKKRMDIKSFIIGFKF